MSEIYIHHEIQQVVELHRSLLGRYPTGCTILDVLETQAQRLHSAHQQHDLRVCVQLKNWHPRFIGRPPMEIIRADVDIDDLRLAVAREHGFESWDSAASDDRPLYEPFEHAATAVVTGNVSKLRQLLLDPSLVCRRSCYGHRASLLHYVAANGVETWRQTVPSNAAEIVQVLIDAGARADVTAHFYGRSVTPEDLLATSAHPSAAGMTSEILAVLRSSPI